MRGTSLQLTPTTEEARISEAGWKARPEDENHDNRSNKQQWDMLSDPATGLELMSTLNGIEELRTKYNVPGTFHKVWKAKTLHGNRVEYDEVSW